MPEVDIARLLSDLENGSVFAVEGDESVKATFTRYRGRDLEFPTVISTSPEHLLAYVDRIGPDALPLWNCSAREAGYRLLLVHLDEEFSTLSGNPDLIQIGPKDFYVRRTRPRPHDPLDDLPPGDYEWRA